MISSQNLSCNNIIIQKAVDLGSVNIETIPEGAKVFIGGTEQPTTTPTILNLPIGQYTYKLSLPGYIDVQGLMNITAGQTYNLTILLEKVNLFTPFIFSLITGGILIGLYILVSKPEQRPVSIPT